MLQKSLYEKDGLSGLFIPMILFYSFFEGSLPTTNMQLYNKLHNLFQNEEISNTQKEEINKFRDYISNNTFTSSTTSKTYKLFPVNELGNCESFQSKGVKQVQGYIVDPFCQYMDFSQKNAQVIVTLLGEDGKLGTKDDIEFAISAKDVESYISNYKNKSNTPDSAPNGNPKPVETNDIADNKPSKQTMETEIDAQEAPSESDSAWERYGIQFVRHITYPKKTTPSWIILKDSQNRFCAIITESKYPILQENNYCIPFSGNDADLKDSFAGNRIAEIDFPDHKKCKKIGIQSSNDYCNRFNQAFENMAEKEKFFDAASVCRLDPNLDDDFTKKVCNLLISKD